MLRGEKLQARAFFKLGISTLHLIFLRLAVVVMGEADEVLC
jgi:hypothetical protein